MVTGDRLAGKTRGEGSGNVLGNRTASNVRKQGRGRDLRKIAAQQGSHQERKTQSSSGETSKLAISTSSQGLAGALRAPAELQLQCRACQAPLSSTRCDCANQASLTSNRHSQQVGGRF